MREWLKLPGLFHRFELEQVIEADGQHEYLFVHAGYDDRRRELIAVYCRHHEPSGGSILDIPRPRPPAVAEGSPAAARAMARGGLS
jgi:hypothetical protein